MTEFAYRGNGAQVTWKHQAHEDKWYIDRKVENHDAIAEHCQAVRNDGGTKDIGGGRLVAQIPMELFYQANSGISHDGKYKGFMQADKDSREKLLSRFFQEDDVKIFMLNSNFKV